jgi:hypothetical protein
VPHFMTLSLSLSLSLSRGDLTFDFLASFVCNSFLDCLVTPWIQTVINFLGFRCVLMNAHTVVHTKGFFSFGSLMQVFGHWTRGLQQEHGEYCHQEG